jgi:uncharacterized DUF497 family protein
MASILESCEGFEWDDGNSGKNWHLHRVTDGECEEIFFNLPLIVDRGRVGAEARFFALGRADSGRRLFVAFTIRDRLIRVISAREMTKSEERKYAEKAKRDSDI